MIKCYIEMALSSREICRYFVSGQCKFGDRCTYAHERSSSTPNICRFNERGTCAYGNACRYDHVKRKKDDISKGMKPPPPPTLAQKSNLNADAPAFIPSWLKKPSMEDGGSYAMAAGSTPSVPLPLLCPYHELDNCPDEETCQYVHGLKCELCNKNVLHPMSEEQQSIHIAECTQKHEEDMHRAFVEQRSKEKTCGICMENIFEKNLRFGILEGCKHCFCVSCIREWRAKTNTFDTNIVRSCPECRQHSDFVVPCVIWMEDKDEKELLFTMFRENTKKKPCKYYVPYSRGDCPFGNRCFYKHENPDGSSPIDYEPGQIDRKRDRRLLMSHFLFPEEEDDDDDSFDILEYFLSEAGRGLNYTRRMDSNGLRRDLIDEVANELIREAQRRNRRN